MRLVTYDFFGYGRSAPPSNSHLRPTTPEASGTRGPTGHTGGVDGPGDTDLRRQHWVDVYGRVAPTEVSWYQPEPIVSLELIDALSLPPDAAIVDVGGGASSLAGALVRRGFGDVTVVDLAEVAVARAVARAGAGGDKVHGVVADVLSWRPARRFALWHDRALFHFLVEPADRDRYRTTLAAALAPGGSVVVGTFARDGPEQCSGLPTARYDPAGLAAELAPAHLELVDARREEHTTPSGRAQPFTWAVLRSRR